MLDGFFDIMEVEESLPEDLNIDGQPYKVRLNANVLTWDGRDQSPRRPVNQVKITDIIGVKLISKKNAFTVHFVICHCMLSRKRKKKHKWTNHAETFVCQGTSTAQKWVAKIKDKIDQVPARPRKILVIVNPASGNRKAPKIYRKKVANIFELAGIDTEVIETKKKNHAWQLMLDKNLDDFDGIVCVGGDGTFAEVVNGLLLRTQQNADIDYNDQRSKLIPPKWKIGIIPAGSTDVVVYDTTGYNDPVTSALQIVLGENLGMDVCSVFCNDKLENYVISFLGYGFFGDVVQRSESCQCLGPKRYYVAGVMKFFRNKSYHGKVQYVESVDKSHSPTDETTCGAGCKICSQIKSSLDVNNQQAEGEVEEEAIAVDQPDHENWNIIEGRYMYVNAALVSGMCGKSLTGVSPSAHIGNGCVDLIVVRKCSRIKYLRHLISLCLSANHLDSEFVEVKRVKKFKFQALTPNDARSSSVWNRDGEVIKQPNIDVNVHCQLINVFARGIEKSCKFCENHEE